MVKENATPLEKLFGSKTRTKLLALFFENTDKSFYVREITRVIEEQINSVRRELINLEGIGIVKNETFDNKIYYSANLKHPFSHALSEMFSAKTPESIKVEVGKSTWADYIKPVKNYLVGLIVTNRVPGEEGIDMLIIGDDKTKKLTHWAEVVEKKKGKPLNYVIMSEDDYTYRKSVRDRFLVELMEMNISEIYDPEKIIKP
ncbi:transcriptional regulator [Candidatus Saccharibacteria bacterium]|nr:transcriptional regulator [Candidatus Saccharibacteria bacterium]MBR2864513.1 transcriptional regulator [Candidatus Saccharibacteria bacterium]MBR3233846.1 transcriptional regulator [Candidatus Saccharibacteria bacterium]